MTVVQKIFDQQIWHLFSLVLLTFSANLYLSSKPEILDGCVGCGVCEMVCPTQQAAIVIDYNKDRGIGKNDWMPDASMVKTVKELK